MDTVPSMPGKGMLLIEENSKLAGYATQKAFLKHVSRGRIPIWQFGIPGMDVIKSPQAVSIVICFVGTAYITRTVKKSKQQKTLLWESEKEEMEHTAWGPAKMYMFV